MCFVVVVVFEGVGGGEEGALSLYIFSLAGVGVGVGLGVGGGVDRRLNLLS